MTVYISTAVAVIKPVAVTDVQAVLGAVPPDCVLDKPWKRVGEVRIERAGVDLVGHGPDNVGAPARPVTGCTIQVVRIEPAQDAGPVQEVVNQGVNRDHAAADLDPAWPTFGGTNSGKSGVGRGDYVPEMIALFGTHSAIALAHEIAMPWHNFRSHQCFQEVVALINAGAGLVPTLLPMIEIVGTGKIAARRALARLATRNQGRVSR